MTPSPRLIAAATLAVWLAGLPAAQADLKMPAIFGDHMVLQQDMPVPVWGTASPGEAIAVNVAGHTAKTVAKGDGKWEVKLPPLAGSPQAMTMTGSNTLTFQDVLIGEVWLCSGQSNMEFTLRNAHNAEEALPLANDSQ